MREAIQGVEVHFSGVGFPEPERSFALIQMCSESAASSASVLACLCFPPRSRKDLIPHASHALVPAVGLSSTWSFGILEFGVSVGGGVHQLPACWERSGFGAVQGSLNLVFKKDLSEPSQQSS